MKPGWQMLNRYLRTLLPLLLSVHGLTAATLARIRGFRGPGNLAMVTHQVNITALTGQYPAQGEIFVVRSNVQGKLELVYRILPPAP